MNTGSFILLASNSRLYLNLCITGIYAKINHMTDIKMICCKFHVKSAGEIIIWHAFVRRSFSITSDFYLCANSNQNMRRQNRTSTFCNSNKNWKQPKQFKIDLDLVVEAWSVRDVSCFNCFVIKLLQLVPDNLDVNNNTLYRSL